jgi:CO/xanthine dehydrogenase FAD-binding subunit
MRSNAAEYDLIAPESLSAALAVLAKEPGAYTPIAGGTELMGALGAGRLHAKRLLSLSQLKELRFIHVTEKTVTLGAGATFTDIRRNEVIERDLPLLAQAASWTGSVANQNRGTIGGNLVNASPAADSAPALLVYGAQLTLLSAAGRRTLPYSHFYTGYKKTALRPEELLYSITLPRDFSAYSQYIRKVGTRSAQAIAKVAVAGLARVTGRTLPDSGSPQSDAGIPIPTIREIRLAAASVREVPARLTATERVLTGRAITPERIAYARAALLAEVRPIDEVRSTAGYRATVAANLLEEFLRALLVGPHWAGSGSRVAPNLVQRPDVWISLAERI